MASINYPRQAVFITSRETIDHFGKKVVKENIHVCTWHMPSSLSPKTYSISIRKGSLTYELIRTSRAFVVNFMSSTMAKEALYCEKHSGLHVDKFKETGLTKEEAENVDSIRIKEALAWLECEVSQEIDLGDHVIFIGNIVNMQWDKFGKRLFMKDKDTFTTTVD